MASLSFPCLDPLGLARLARGAGEARDQLGEERALFEILTEARMRRRNPIERQHLLHGIGIAEQHHDFLQIRAAHGLTPEENEPRGIARVSYRVTSKAQASVGRFRCDPQTTCFQQLALAQREVRSDRPARPLKDSTPHGDRAAFDGGISQRLSNNSTLVEEFNGALCNSTPGPGPEARGSK